MQKKCERVTSSTPSVCYSDTTYKNHDISWEAVGPSVGKPVTRSLRNKKRNGRRNTRGGNNRKKTNGFNMFAAARKIQSKSERVLMDNNQTKKVGKVKKRRQSKPRKPKQTFKNTVVLAPFHALKLSFQNKVKDLYSKGRLNQLNSDRVNLPNSEVQFEIIEMTPEQWNLTPGKVSDSERKKKNGKKKNDSQENNTNRKISENLDESEYCQCLKNRKRALEEQFKLNTQELEKNVEYHEQDAPSTSQQKTMPLFQTESKRIRLEQINDGESGYPSIEKNVNLLNTSLLESKKDLSKSFSDKSFNHILNSACEKPEYLVHKNTKKLPIFTLEPIKGMQVKQPKKTKTRKKKLQKLQNFKYITRSVTKREGKIDTKQSNECHIPVGKKKSRTNRNLDQRNEAVGTRMASMGMRVTNRTLQRCDKNCLDETKDTSLVGSTGSGMNILILKEINADAKAPGRDFINIIPGQIDNLHKEVSLKAFDRYLNPEDNKETSQKSELTPTSISEVTKMFHTLLKEPQTDIQISKAKGSVLNNYNDNSKAECIQKKSFQHIPLESTTILQKTDLPNSPDRRLETEKDQKDSNEEFSGCVNIEPNVIVQSCPYETSSSDRISDGSAKMEDSSINFSTGIHRRSFTTMAGTTDGLDKTSTYIFGPKNRLFQVRDACEYGFGLSRSPSENKVDDFENANSEYEKHF